MNGSIDAFLETLRLLVKNLDRLQLNEVDALTNNLITIIRPAVVRRLEREAAEQEAQVGPIVVSTPGERP